MQLLDTVDLQRKRCDADAGRLNPAEGGNMRTCPKCGIEYTGHHAISREDNITEICPACGVREAMQYMGVPSEDAEEVVELVKKYGERFEGDEDKKA